MSEVPEEFKDDLIKRYDFSFSENLRVAFKNQAEYRYERIDSEGHLLAFSQWISFKQAVCVQNVFLADGHVGNIIIQPQMEWTEVKHE